MNAVNLRLISSVTCPFVQRAVIALQEKNVATIDTSYIDLAAPPEWFLHVSPRGKVPVLQTPEGPLFESLAICEYIDETTNPISSLMPPTAFGRAEDRAWAAFVGEDLFGPLYMLMTAPDLGTAQTHQASIERSLVRLDGHLKNRNFLSAPGTHYGMADVCAAPFAMRALDARSRGWYDLFEGKPAARAWAECLYERPSTRASVPSDYAKAETDMLEARGSVWIRRPQETW
jgi:glutathione S-transferase